MNKSLYFKVYKATTPLNCKVTTQQSLNRYQVYTTPTSRFTKVSTHHLYMATNCQQPNTIKQPNLNKQPLYFCNLYKYKLSTMATSIQPLYNTNLLIYQSLNPPPLYGNKLPTTKYYKATKSQQTTSILLQPL